MIESSISTMRRSQKTFGFSISLVILLGLLSSCQFGGGGQVEMGDPDEVRFLTPWQPGGGMGLYLQTTGEPVVVQESIRNFTRLGRGQFQGMGIPPNALKAATFRERRDANQDFQAIFAVKDEGRIKAYRGYFVPGLGGPMEWKTIKLGTGNHD